MLDPKHVAATLEKHGWTPEKIREFFADLGWHLDIETGEWQKGLLP